MSYAKRIKDLRVKLIKKYGKRQYKIVGQYPCQMVHVYSKMPNTDIVGWWLMGDIVSAELWLIPDTI